MRDLVTQISLMMETAFSEESDVIEKLHQLLGELAAVGASLQDTAIQKKNLDGLTLSEMFLMQNVTQLLHAANDFSIYLRAASLAERSRGDLGPTAKGYALRSRPGDPDYFAIPLHDRRVSLASLLILLSFFMTSLCGLAAFLRPLYVLPARLFPNVTRQHHSDGRSPKSGSCIVPGRRNNVCKGTEISSGAT